MKIVRFNAFTMNSNQKFLPFFTVFLLVVNLLIFGLFGAHVSSIARFVSMVLFFLLSLRPQYFKRSALILFSAFVLNDFLLIYYESSLSQNLILFIRLGAYLLLARMVMPYLKKIKMEKFQIIIFSVVLILNLVLLHQLNDSINPEESTEVWEEVLLYGYGTAIILAVSVAFTFYNRFTDKASILFLVALMALVMSDFTFFIGYYLGFSVFFYLDRAFNIIAIGVLLHFIYLYKKKIEIGYYNKTQTVL